MVAVLFSSHSIIAYPILARFGLQKHEVVAVTVSATAITDIASLVLLAVCLPIHMTGFSFEPFLLQILFIAGFIPAIIFLVLAPYNRNRFIRFHSFQCLFLTVALIAIHLALSILTVVPFLALVTLPLHLLVSLGAFVLWIVLLLKANQGQMYKLPLIGDMAEKQANAI
jgi:uncharacterized membrane protein